MLRTHNRVRQGRSRDERGTALVELALVMPLLLVLLLGMLDFGKAFNEWMSQTQLASEGARLASVNYCPNPSSDGSGNLTCDWATQPPSPISCGSPNANLCLAQYIDNQTLGELNTGRTKDPYAPAQNKAQVCISYPNGSLTKVGDPVHVTLKVYYHWLNYLSRKLAVGTTPITGSATMRLESKPFSGVPLDQTTCYPSAPAGTA
jgi:Flp pilus assembly protein TadG